MSTFSLIDHLNPPQREAVLHTEGPLLIFAGAGSGKTRVLTHRIAHLIQNCGLSPWSLFAVTFTNKAAGEMKGRIGKLLSSRADDVWISTFHSAGVKILRRHPEKAGLGPFFTIFDDLDQMTLIKEALDVLQINPKLFNPRAIAGKINAAKNELVTAEEFALRAEDFFDEKIAKVYVWYQEALHKNNAVDFGDLLLLPVKMFEKHPEILKLYHDRLKYFLVDEYQDTNHAQYQLMKLLSQTSQNLCVVGDDDQSIYRWRGADIQNILDFEVDFPAAKVIKLEQNYRSTQNIIQAAGVVVSKIENRRAKKLWTENEVGDPIIHFTAGNEKNEAAFVVREIRELTRGDHSYADCSVFYRTNAQSRVIEDELRRHNIPYIIVGGTRFYDRMEVKDILAYLYVIANPSDSLHLKRIINVPGRGIGKTSVEKLEALANQNNISLFESLSQVSSAGIASKTAQAIRSFSGLLERLKTGLQNLNSFPSPRPMASPPWRASPSRGEGEERLPSPLEGEGVRRTGEGASGNSLSEWVKSVMEETGYLKDLENEKTLEAEDRIENLEELVSVVADYENSNPEPTLGGFLEQITLASGVDDLAGEKGVLPLMTLHLAKGLEFDYVFMMGLEEGLFPHTRSFESPEEMDEERRLMYVGMTRARKKLFLTHALQRSLYGNEQWNLPSRFLEDIPPELVEKKEEKKAVSTSLHFASEVNHFVPIQIEKDSTHPYKIGRKVKHPIFGMGTIQNCEGNAEDRKITIQFQGGQLKRLVAKYCNLQLM